MTLKEIELKLKCMDKLRGMRLDGTDSYYLEYKGVGFIITMEGGYWFITSGDRRSGSMDTIAEVIAEIKEVAE